MRLPQRAIHLDFHTMPAVPDVGADFDPEEFAATLAEARVDAITVFAKCNLGMAYYPTKVGVVHPSLKRDLLGEMVAACHRRDIRIAAYFNAGLDHEMAQRHRDWAVLDREGRLLAGDRTANFFRLMCFAGPWRDHLMKMIEEVLTGYEIDGLSLDCFVWNTACYGDECLRALHDRGLDVNDHSAVAAAQNHRMLDFVRGVRRLIDAHRPEATYYLNGVPFDLQADIASHFDVESLPAGGWGYMDFPWKARYLRSQTKHLVRQTGRFHDEWGDFGGLRTQAGLDFDCCQAISLGAACSIGDHMHPRGQLNRPVYERVGAIYQRIADLEPWTRGAKPVSEAAVVVAGLKGSTVSPGQEDDVVRGATRMFEELKVQFDIIDPDGDWSGYRMLILTDPLRLDGQTLAKVRDHVAREGTIVSTASAGLLADGEAFAEPWGLDYVGPADWRPGFFRALSPLDADVPDMPVKFSASAVDVRPRGDTEMLAQIVAPYFNRHWDGFHGHFYTPPDAPTGAAATTQCGPVMHIAFSVFRDYAGSANPAHRGLVAAALRRLLPDPLVTAANLPSFARMTLTAQDERLMVHVLSYLPELRGREMEIVEEPIVLRNVHLSVRRQTARRVYLAPDEHGLTFGQQAGRIEFEVAEVAGYQMIVIE